MKRLTVITSVAVLLLCLTATCGRKGPDAPPDTTPPTIIATNPGIANNSGVPIDTVITVTFSEPVNQSTITFTLAGGGSTIPCDMSYSNTTATFTPQSPLALNTMYTASVGGVRDLAGNVMAGDYTWFFATGQAPTTVQISAPVVTYNANSIVTVTVSATVGTPSGGVSLSVDGGAATMQGLIGGSTTFTIPSPSAGSHTLSATYAKQGDFEASSAVGTLIVNQAGTTMNITAPGVTYGADGIVTVTVSSTVGTPTGNVSLSVDNGASTAKSLVNGSATFTISNPSAGSHVLSAAYAAQGNYGASSATGTLGVGAEATSMTLNAPGVTYNANGIVTVTVSSTAGVPTGDVSLSVDNGSVVMKQTLVGGTTIFTIPSPAAGNHDLNATYAAQGNFWASSATGTLVVNKAATTTNITSPGVTYGADGIVTVTVSSTAGTPTGEVSLSVDSGPTTTQSLNSGSATFTIPSPSTGNHTLSAAYAAQGNYGASSATGTLGVGAEATSTIIDAPGVTYNANGIVTVTVSSTSGTPAGNVSLSVDSEAPITQTLSNGSATFTIISPNAGTHTLNAAYAAQGNFGPSSISGTLVVNKAATTTNITAPSVAYGADGIVTVTVNSTAGTPTGEVSLSVDGGPTTTQLLNNGATTFTIMNLNAGNHTLSATYAAQGNYGASSATGTLGVGAEATSMTLNAPEVTYGTNGSVTVTVSSTAGTPTGDVSLSVDGGSATTQSLDNNGSAIFAISSPTAGTHTLNAAYAAQGSFGASSASGTLIVDKAGTTTSVSSDLNPSTYGGAVTFTATVNPSTATGTVTFMDGTTTIGSGTLSGGQATLSTSALGEGTHSITAVYSGDTNYSGSTSIVLSQTVSQASTSTSLTSSPNPSALSSSVTFTATVTPSTATGTVNFIDGTTVLGTGTLSGGVATFSTSALDAGVHSITAEYGGDANFTASASSALSQTVDYTITATAGQHGSISPSGTVLVSSGADQMFTITAAPKHTIADVLVDGNSVGTILPGTTTYTYDFLAVTANHTISAIFL